MNLRVTLIFIFTVAKAVAESGWGVVNTPSDFIPPKANHGSGTTPSVCYLKLEAPVTAANQKCLTSPTETSCSLQEAGCRWVNSHNQCLSRVALLCQEKMRSLCEKIVVVTDRFPASAKPNDRKFQCVDDLDGQSVIALPRGS
jgi:hypothetical protein